METSECVFVVETVNFTADFIGLEQEEVCEKEWDNLATVFIYGHLFRNLIQNSEVGIIGRLDETVAQNGHLIHLESVGGHYFKQLLKPILQEVELSLLGVHVQKLVTDDGQRFNHQVQNIVSLA